MATEVVELTGDESGLLRSIDRAVAKEEQLDAKLARTAAVGGEMGEELEKAFGTVAKSDDKALRGMLRDLQRLGPEGRDAGRALRAHFIEAGKVGYRSMEAIIDEISELDPVAGAAAKEASEKIRAEMAAAEQASDFEVTLKALAKLGDQGKAIAAGIRADLVQADTQAGQDMDQVLAKLAGIRPEVQQSAERIKAELAAAADFSEGKFAETLSTLRSMGPVGKQVADGLKSNLVEAGKLSERSIESVIEEIERIDPAAAAAARKLHTEMAGAANKSETAFDRFTNSAVAKIGTVVLAYASVGRVVSEVTRYLEDQKRLLDDTLDAHSRLAIAQQQAAKNLAGLTAIERDELLQFAVPEIARETGFADTAQITTALGTAVSSGADSQLAREAVLQSARIEMLTPEDLDETAAGAVAVARQTGLSDIRQSIALLETAGTAAAVVDPAKLIQSLPRALTASGSIPGQDQELNAREIASLFGEVTRAGNDREGNSSATFVTTFTAELDKFFGQLEKQSRNARSELQVLSGKATLTEKDEFRIEELNALIPALEQATNPDTLFARIEALQQNEVLKKEFVGEGFGDQQFRGFLNSVFEENSQIAQSLGATFTTIRADADFFEREAEKLSKGTNQLAILNATQVAASGINVDQSFNNEGAALAAVRDIYGNALNQTVSSFGEGVFNYTFGSIQRRGGLRGGTALEEGVSAVEELAVSRRELEVDGVTFEEQRKVDILDSAIKGLEQLIGNVNPTTLAPGSLEAAAADARSNITPILPGASTEDVARFERMNATFERIALSLEQQLEAAKQTADNTKPRPVDPGQAQRSAAALANQRAAEL